jgi:hypothetical protein
MLALHAAVRFTEGGRPFQAVSSNPVAPTKHPSLRSVFLVGATASGTSRLASLDANGHESSRPVLSETIDPNPQF